MSSPPCGTTRTRPLQARRLRAVELFAVGVTQAEVARQLEVSAQAVSVWHARWKPGGTDALRSRGPSGPAPRLSDAQLAKAEQALLEGAAANGFVGELWTWTASRWSSVGCRPKAAGGHAERSKY